MIGCRAVVAEGMLLDLCPLTLDTSADQLPQRTPDFDLKRKDENNVNIGDVSS